MKRWLPVCAVLACGWGAALADIPTSSSLWRQIQQTFQQSLSSSELAVTGKCRVGEFATSQVDGSLWDCEDLPPTTWVQITSGGTMTGITADSGGTTTGATVTLAGGTNGLDTSRSGDTITLSFDPTETFAAAIPLANGGTNRSSAWTASKCVRVNSGGTALEPAAADCGSGGGGGGTATILADTVISDQSASSDVSNFTFTSISGSYYDLYLVMFLRSDRSANNDAAKLTINSDTTASDYQLAGFYAGYYSNVADHNNFRQFNDRTMGAVPAASATTDLFGALTMRFPRYSSNKLKLITIVQQNLYTTNLQNTEVIFSAGLWNSTSAITSIVVAPSLGTVWKAGSKAVLVGRGPLVVTTP